MGRPRHIHVPAGKTTLIDIYEAGGAVASEDRSSVTMTAAQMKPFKIELLVYPGTIEWSPDGEKITFNVLLVDETVIEDSGWDAVVHQIDHSGVEITLPVSQVKIVKEEA